VPAEVLKIHPQSLRGLVEGAGGNYLTGGGAAFTSVALAKFVVSAVEALATHPAPQAAPDIIESVCDILCRMNEAPGTHTRESWKSEIRRAIVGLRTGALPAPQAPAAGAEVAPSESNEWIKQARRTLDRLAAFLQRIGAPHAIDWREWIHNAEVMVLALQDPAAVKQSLTAAPGEPRELARAVLIAEEAQQFAEDRTHLGRRVYINDLVWALRTLAAARAEPAGGRVDEREALANLVRYVERNECQHESTHRGGSIWTICDDCGRKWADDRGGFKPYEPAPELEAARAALSAQQPQEKP
jgi:ribosomal protein L37AE/L43A